MAARSGILGLGSRLYPGNMQRIFNKDLTRFMQSPSRERQNRASKRKALLAGCVGFAIIMQISYTLLRGQTTQVREVIANILATHMIYFTFFECLSPK